MAMMKLMSVRECYEKFSSWLPGENFGVKISLVYLYLGRWIPKLTLCFNWFFFPNNGISFLNYVSVKCFNTMKLYWCLTTRKYLSHFKCLIFNLVVKFFLKLIFQLGRYYFLLDYFSLPCFFILFFLTLFVLQKMLFFSQE